MNEIAVLEEKRNQILQQMRTIRAMRKGSVTEQYLKVTKKGKKEPSLRGPYWLYSRKEKGKTVGRRLRRGEVEGYREEVHAYHRFQVLCADYAKITERLGELEREKELSSREKKRLK
jgi:hypothetical protein